MISDSLSGPPNTVLLVDDHAVVRAGLRALIDEDPAFAVVAEAGDGGEGVDLYERHLPDLTVLDLLMPKTDGLACAQAILERMPHAAILALTSHEGDETARRALALGVRGYLLKRHAGGNDLLAAMHGVLAGARHIPPEVGGLLADGLTGGTLSARQTEVLELFAAGLSEAGIAERLAITPGTVHLHLTHIVDRLGAAHRAEAVTTAVRRGIISLR